jgi:Protein of unknown function (DUF3089)
LMMTYAQSLITGVVALALTILTVGSRTVAPVRAAPPRLAVDPASAAPAPHQQASTVWLCRPGLPHNPCAASLTTTIVPSNGATSVQRVAPATHPPIDCFFVYGTVSRQPTVNATLRIDPAERAIARLEASRFSQVCRVYAPMYRQITPQGFQTPQSYAPHSPAAAIATASVLAAWRHYLAYDNQGRGVVLIGHSQGASVLIDLLRAQIDANPALRRRLVSALLLGGNVLVPVGKDVGGSFQHIPACRAARQTGCVVAYSAFNTRPTALAYFGRVVPARLAPWQAISPAQAAHLQVLCTNPAALAGGTGALDPYFITTPLPLGTRLVPFVHAPVPSPPNPWVTYPDLYTARCMSRGGVTWLQVTDVAGPADHRWVVRAAGPQYGLHLYDELLAYGNLVALVRAETAAYTRRTGGQ